MSTWTEEETEEDALRFRRRIGIEDDQVWVDAPTLLFKLHHYFGIGYQRLLNNELPDPGGQWDANNRHIKLNESVFVGANDPNPLPRCRWTVVHEVSHAALGDAGIRNRSAKDSLEKRTSGRIKSIEARADRFTAALLAPLHLIRPDESAESIALRFGLSKTAAEIRAKDAAKNHRRKHNIKREIPDSIKKIIDELKRNSSRKK
jgi:Zn-dependent peptidase ImmA (M78 family)